MTTDQNREAWLIEAAKAMTPWFTENDREVPPMRLSVGWPGGRSNKNTTRGQCWPSVVTGDKTAQIFISPIQVDTVITLGVLLHEMAHAVDDCKSSHSGDFIKIARELGFKSKWTSSTNRTDELTERLQGLAETLGEFPSAAIEAGARGADAPKTQTTRMLKLQCGSDGYVARTTKKWIEQLGLPSCPCGEQMDLA